jgi:hypothetical protein
VGGKEVVEGGEVGEGQFSHPCSSSLYLPPVRSTLMLPVQ